MTVIGSVDQYDPLTRLVKGWATIQGDEPVTSTVLVKHGGEVITEAVANLYREDLESAGIHDGCVSFELALPKLPVGSVVSFHEKETDHLLHDGELVVRDSLACVSFNLEGVSDTVIHGWALHTEHKKPLKVLFRLRPVGGGCDMLVAQGVADIVRPDIESGRACGFKLATNLQTIKAFPARLIMFVEGVEIAACHILLPMSTDSMMKQMEKRLESLMGLTIARMEQDIQQLRSGVK